MSRFSINYNEVWKEVESAEFVNMAPSNEYDRDSVSRLADLIREGLQFLEHSAQLSPAQIKELKTKIRKLEAQLAKESALARRVDPTVPLYPGQRNKLGD